MQVQQQKKIKLLRLAILTGMIAISAVVTLFVWAIPDLQRSRASTHWPTTQGSIVTSEVVRTTGGYRSVPTSSIDLRYAFTVNGKSYISSLIGYRGEGAHSYADDNKAQAIRTQNYPVGKSVTVYYNPIKPQESVLISGVGIESFAGFGLSAFLLVFAMMLWISGIKMSKMNFPVIRQDSPDIEHGRAKVSRILPLS